MNKIHHYQTSICWTGNLGEGTKTYNAYSRDHELQVPGKPSILLSSDPAFRGDATRYNPEELFLAALSSCHMLWFLHLCADNGIVVINYKDQASGTMEEDGAGGRFTEVILRPEVTVADATMIESCNALHEAAHGKCYIANSCNFPVRHQPTCRSL